MMLYRKLFSKVLLVVIAVLLWLDSGLAVAAQRETLMQADVPAEGLTDPAELESFWNGFFAREMEDFGVHGAAMVMVKDGEILFSKGYGYADAEKQVPFDPEDTILRAGSIAKTVTATAVMQLAEQGKLDLEADVNDYLTLFEVPDAFAEPVTTRELINMTGGFDTRSSGIRAASAEEVQPLGEYLAERMPPRVLPPGRYRRYNDHEIALAGYLVEVVSGMAYEQYVQDHIFEPLEMADSSVWLPEEQLERAARGYPVGKDEAYPLNYYYYNDAPGAGFNSTADDMAHYMIAHLQNGAYMRSDGTPARILDAATASAMHQTAFSYHPEMAGQANAFDEQFYNDNRYLRKSGGAPGMHNNMLLLLDQGLGFYLFYNSEGTGLRNSWQGEVLEMYLSTPGSDTAQLGTAGKTGGPVSGYAGLYQEISDGTSETTIVQARALFDPDLHLAVAANPDGSLQIWGRRYLEVEPGVFQYPDTGEVIKFEVEKGRANYLFQARTPYKRIPTVESPPVQIGLLVFSVLVFLSSLGALVVSLIQGKTPGSILSALVSGLNILFLVSLVEVLMPVATGGDIWQFSFEPSPQLRLILALPIISSALATGLLARTVLAWRRGSYRLALRVQNTLVLLAMVALLYFLNTWNLLGWRF